MTAKRLYVMLVIGTAVGLALLFVGLYVGDISLKQQADKLHQARLDNATLGEKQLELTKQRSSIKKYKSLGAVAKQIVPQDKDQAQTVREIVKIAGEQGLNLGSISFGASTLGGTGKSANPDLSQLKPVKDIKSVYKLEITIQSDVDKPTTLGKFINFLDGLEQNRRTALVSSIILQPKEDNPSLLNFSLIVNEYIKP